MQKIQDMNDFELYIHALAQGECAEEDVCVLSEPAGAYFSNEQQDDSLAWLIRQLFDGLDTWSREGHALYAFRSCLYRKPCGAWKADCGRSGRECRRRLVIW